MLIILKKTVSFLVAVTPITIIPTVVAVVVTIVAFLITANKCFTVTLTEVVLVAPT